METIYDKNIHKTIKEFNNAFKIEKKRSLYNRKNHKKAWAGAKKLFTCTL